MNSFRRRSWLQPTVWTIALGVVSNVVYLLLRVLVSSLQLDPGTAPYLFLTGGMLAAAVLAARYRHRLRRVGVVKIHKKAEDTIEEGLQEAAESYYWLGTSAYYVLCTPKTREQYIETKRRTDFVFITVDPACPAAVREQARWERLTEAVIAERVADTRQVIDRLRQSGINVSWEGHSTFPTFRIVIINEKKLFVSFYERGKLGPECEQLEIEGESLLGRWFIQFFEKSRAAANRMRIERRLGRFLYEQAGLSEHDLVQTVKRLCPDDDPQHVERVVQELAGVPSP